MLLKFVLQLRLWRGVDPGKPRPIKATAVSRKREAEARGQSERADCREYTTDTWEGS
jgi:hypothetical protein